MWHRQAAVLASLPVLASYLASDACHDDAASSASHINRMHGQMFRKVGAPEFRKEGEREKKEKIVESKKKTSTTPVESRSSYSNGIGDRRSIFYRTSTCRSRIITVHDVEKYMHRCRYHAVPIIDLRVP